MLSPDLHLAAPFDPQAFSPASRDPRFSRRTPDELFARISKADGDRVVGSGPLWAGRILREKSRKRATTSPAREKLMKRLRQTVSQAEEAAKPKEAATPSTFEQAPAAEGHRYARSAFITLGGDAHSPLLPVALDGPSLGNFACPPCRFA